MFSSSPKECGREDRLVQGPKRPHYIEGNIWIFEKDMTPEQIQEYVEEYEKEAKQV